ncbi:MAG: AI-2E family transporter [bacterium]|nr:AI-2E family transporter [bacterium]MDZ4300015.1 AI-2E family transporter [Candidatus Sungbacteria bacterium]
MHHKKSELYFLYVLLTGIFILTFFIFRPFLYTLVVAVVFATVFKPIHQKMLIVMRGREALAALLATILVLIIVVVPLIFFSVQIFQEAVGLYSFLFSNGGRADFSLGVSDAIRNIAQFSPVPIEISVDVNQYIKQGLRWLLQNLGPISSNVARMLLAVFIFLVALYYLFKDGYKLKRAVVALSPLPDVHNEIIFNKLMMAINSVVKGSIMVALIQGIIAAIGFVIFGIPNAALWGSITAVAALVPGIGTALVLFPAILYLFLNGETFSAGGLLLWGMMAVGLVDNFLGPKLVERDIHVHPFLILLSILGGIGFFGPLGFLLGPLVLSMLFVLLDIYFMVRKERENNNVSSHL